MAIIETVTEHALEVAAKVNRELAKRLAEVFGEKWDRDGSRMSRVDFKTADRDYTTAQFEWR